MPFFKDKGVERRHWEEIRIIMYNDDMQRLFIKDENMKNDKKLVGIINNPKYQPIINRFKSLLWRLGAFCVVAIIDFVLVELINFQVNETILLIISLVLGEISKYLNNKYGLKKN